MNPPNCPMGPPDQMSCEQVCNGGFKTQCPFFDNFIDCGGGSATWSCDDTNPSGVKPSTCTAEWQCMLDNCFM